MWHLMIFCDVERTQIAKVMTLLTMHDVAAVVGLPTQVVSNFYHKMIRSHGNLRYIALFKG